MTVSVCLSASIYQKLSSLRVLGVIVNDQLTATDHVSNILASCNSLLYALRTLRSHGIPVTSLYDVFRSTVITKLTYCAPSWSGACSAADRAKLESFVSRCKRLDYCSSEVPTYSDLTDEADDTLFSRIMSNQGHVLQPLMPDRHRWEVGGKCHRTPSDREKCKTTKNVQNRHNIQVATFQFSVFLNS